jgi:hypothetical protein
MKLFILLFTSIFTALSFSQTVILSEDFETGIPATWSISNQDLLTPNAVVSEYNEAWISTLNPEDSTDSVAGSTSYFTTSGRANRWLISPPLTLGPFGNYLRWESKSFDPSYPESLKVFISTTGNDVASFTDTLEIIVNENSIWTNHEINLSELGYANQVVYIAFILNTNDGFKFLLDDVNVRTEDPVLLAEIEKNHFSVLPNPVENLLIVSNHSEIKSISILSLENKQILFTENSDTYLNLSTLNSGVYFVEIMTTNGLKLLRKIVKI